MLGNFTHQHFAVKRNASAPEPSSQQQQQQQHQHIMSRSPVPNLVQIEPENSDTFSSMHRPQHHLQQQQQQQHLQQQQNFGGLRREFRPMQLPHQISADMKLCKSKSE